VRVPQLRLSVHKRLGIALAALFLLLVAGIGFIYYRARHSEDRLRQLVVQQLSDHFHSRVELQTLRVHIFPRIAVEGEGLVLRWHNREDFPPLIRVGKFSFVVSISGLLRPIKHIPLIQLSEMVVTIPPREHPETTEGAEPIQNSNKMHVSVVVDKILCDDTDIVILPKKAGKVPLDWDIHDLVLYSVGPDQPFSFRGNLTNGKPKGEIQTNGQFGPWDADDPGGSPVSGEYKFTDADLDPFPGIGGTLSSTGKYSGALAELQVEGETDTPNFSLDKVGKPVPLHTEFSATVDGTNGDTLLHPVNARLVKTLIVTNGSVMGVPQQGHLIAMDAVIPDGRIQDILNLAINSDKPLMTGPVKLKAKIVIPPGNAKAIEKLVLDGQFGVTDATWSNPKLREKLQSLSRRAEGKPGDEDAGSAVSDLKGSFHLDKGILNFRSLTFAVQGARIDLAGTYGLRGGELDMKGHLRLDAKISQTMTGAKSFFLKALDPFFAKSGAGTELPITITGTREKPVFGVSVFHKTIKKNMAGF
jgi:hypothetical protein